ncbi:MAG: hypothetical protein A2X14_12530 [Bacteroidetes bacterium GWD2_33_33]|nr:MAG: hypothetical protein A2X14_12530 [Bacteroidetes bacterium GWD2_33_33]
MITVFIFRRYVKKVQKQFEQQQTYNQHQNSKEGDILIQKPSQSKKRGFEDKGEYIDYEEIK